jgi:hypothetical protein
MAIDHVTRTWPYDPAGIIAWSAGVMQIPILASIAWWDALRGAEAANRHCADNAAPAHELVVPTPIEDEGERALFA